MSLDKTPRAQEQEAVRTTIVGGRPPGCGKSIGTVPRGLEVLVKKASVDPQFRTTLLEKRAAAAQEIGLALSPAEVQMLRIAPAAQLDAIIDNAHVKDEHRPAFLGKVAAVMLAALGIFQAGCEDRETTSAAPSDGPEAQAPPAQTTPATNPATTEPKIEIVAGDRVEVPLREPNIAIFGFIADRPPTTQGTRIEPKVTLLGLIADRPPTTQPENTVIRGVRPTPRREPNVTVYGVMPDRPPTTQPENTVIRGIRPIPPRPLLDQRGIRPDRPEIEEETPQRPAIAGIMPRTPAKPPTTKPSTQPAPTPPAEKEKEGQ